MAKHILKGEFPVFFYGQPYMGSMEAFILALFFWILGASARTMALGMTFISTLGIISAYFLGKELKDKKLGLYSMLIYAIPPAYIFWHGLSAFGGYPETLLFGNILLTLTLKTTKTKETNQKVKYYLLLGFFSGLALWTHLLIIYYIIPLAFFLLLKEEKKFLFSKTPFLVLPALILGGLPLWTYNLTHNFDTFRLPSTNNPITVFGHFFEIAYVLFFGDSLNWLFMPVLLVYIIAFLFTIYSPNKKEKIIRSEFIAFLLLSSILYIFLKNYHAAETSPRHIMPLFTVVLISSAYFAWYLDTKHKHSGLIIILLIISCNGTAIYRSYSTDKKGSDAVYNLYNKLINFLTANELTTNYGEFQFSEKLNFLSNEKIITATYADERYLPFEEKVEASDKIAFISECRFLEPTLNMLCRKYDMKQIDPFIIYYNLFPKTYFGNSISPKNWKALSNYSTKYTSKAFDRNYDSYWTTIAHKNEGMYFQLDMGKTYKIYKIAIFNGDHWLNYPENLSIEVSKDNFVWEKLNMPDKPFPLFYSGPRLYAHLIDGQIEFVFKPVECRYIKIIQNGIDTLNPFEIDELFVWEYKKDTNIAISEANTIYHYLAENNIKNLYADFWISAKIKYFSNNKITTLKPINIRHPYQEGTSRFINFSPDTAFAICNDYASEFENFADEEGLTFIKNKFIHYTCYTLKDLPLKPTIYRWSGYGLLKTNRINPEFQFKFITNKHQIIFTGNYTFIGYNMYKTEDNKLNMEYFWDIKQTPVDIFVFVYFMQNEKIIFQNDHPLLEQFLLSEKTEKKHIFRETYILKNIPSGTYDLVIGLYIPQANGQRIKTISPKKGESRILLGKITI
jgi:hypothetical protein